MKRGMQVSLAVFIRDRSDTRMPRSPGAIAVHVWHNVFEDIRPEFGSTKDEQLSTLTHCVKLLLARGLVQYSQKSARCAPTTKGLNARKAEDAARKMQKQGRKTGRACQRQRHLVVA